MSHRNIATYIALPAVCFSLLVASYGQGMEGSVDVVVSARLANQYANEDRVTVQIESGRVEYHAIDIKSLFLKADGIQPYSVVWPRWVDDQPTFYDVSATAPSGLTSNQLQSALKTLMTDRFGLLLRGATRNLDDYALIASPHGIKIHRSEHLPTVVPPDYLYCPSAEFDGWHFGELPLEVSTELGAERSSAGHTIAQLISCFSQYLDRPLVDATGLEGFYDIDMSISTDSKTTREESDDSRVSSPLTWSTAGVFASFEKQLGLVVVRRRGLAELLIIDRLDRIPKEN